MSPMWTRDESEKMSRITSKASSLNVLLHRIQKSVTGSDVVIPRKFRVDVLSMPVVLDDEENDREPGS